MNIRIVLVLSVLIIGGTALHTSIWDDIAKPFKEAGTQLESVVKKVGDFFEKDVYETALKKYVWEKGLSQLGRIGEIKDAIKNIGKQLMIGSTELKDAPEKLRKGNEKLQTQLVAGIENQIIAKTKSKAGLVAAKREEIARTRAVVEKVGPTLTALGLGALVDDLTQGLQAADAALAVLVDWNALVIPPQIVELVDQVSQDRCIQPTRKNECRKNLMREVFCDPSSPWYQKAQPYKPQGVNPCQEYLLTVMRGLNPEEYGKGSLVDLFQTAETAVNTTKDLINKVDSNITTLQNKINRKDFCIQGGLCTLPERMVALGSTLASFTW